MNATQLPTTLLELLVGLRTELAARAATLLLRSLNSHAPNHYVSSLSSTELSKIKFDLDADALATPNDVSYPLTCSMPSHLPPNERLASKEPR